MSKEPGMPPKIDFADEEVTPDQSLFEEEQTEPVFSRHVLTSPLHMSVARASRTNSWAPWNGITAAQVLTDIDDEYLALKTRASLSDMSPLVKYRISGRDVTAYLKRLMIDDVSTLDVNRVVSVMFCEENGFVVGDGQLFRLDEMEYRLVTERSHLSWLSDNLSGFRVKLEDVSMSLAAMRLAGPLARETMSEVGFDGIAELKENAAHWYRPGGAPAYVSRTNLPHAYDIWVDREDASPLWARLMQAGEPFGLSPIGRCVSEIARIEAGLLREGQDYIGAFYAADRSHAVTPFDLGWESRFGLAHGVFNGRASLRRMAGTSARWTFLHVEFEADRSQSFKAIYLGKKIVGELTSSTFSRLLGKHVGLARVQSAVAKSTGLQAAATSLPLMVPIGPAPVPVLSATDSARSDV